ncbi:RagB/SusD family nutrient uptake outer membrane protein [Ekhidna sp. To15]|uniref:RagB/SusD family nutrient uptake outer membrane protein n=1 Tax=Ekhidna sp. To15 TaxID=3395267 RepID=UPI003F5240B5
MKILNRQLSILMVLIFVSFSCELEETVDPNQPSLDGVTSNAGIGQLNELVTGIIARASTGMATYHDIAGVIGRDVYRFDVSDPRWVGDLLGTGNLDNSAFYTATNFSTRYNGVKTSNVLIDAAQNTTVLTNAQAQGYLAFAKTFKAIELLHALNHQYNNGIRIDVSDPNNLGAYTNNAAEAYTAISEILAEAAGHISNAGSEFAFSLTAGFAGFDDPSGFGEFIKAMQARVAVYEGDFTSALAFVNQSFLDETGNFDLGVYRVYANASGDRVNPLFYPLNTNGTTKLAHPDWVADAEAGDTRLSKASLRTDPISTAGLTATHDAFRYQTNTDPIPFIRNEELILIKAEALIQQNTGASLAEAVTLLDLIRVSSGGLAAYSGTVDQASLLDEMLNQRRYSLFDEGHRWVDMRRYDRLDELTIDRTGDSVIEQLPRPFNEVGVQGG